MKLLKVEDIAELFQTSTSTIYRWVHTREIPFVTLGGKLRFSPDEIQEYIKQNSVSIS